MSHELVLQECRGKPPKVPDMPRQIKIFHPGYDDKIVPLMYFPGYDSKEGDLWYDVAHTACAIITNNRFDGYLSTRRDSQSSRVSGDLLAPGNYWWHLPGGILSEMCHCAISCLQSLDFCQPYAIIADFRDWQYPQYVPENWRSPTLKREKKEIACQLSQEYHSLNKAHIVPTSETEWFNTNGLHFLYGANSWTNPVLRNLAGILKICYTVMFHFNFFSKAVIECRP